jgi:dTDP-4-dehydrorhamnose 3,5-epimerase
VPPGVIHAYKSLSKDGIVINLPDKLYRGKGKRGKVDEMRHEDDPNSPYRIS